MFRGCATSMGNGTAARGGVQASRLVPFTRVPQKPRLAHMPRVTRAAALASLAVGALAAGALGCGPGFTLRAHGATSIAATGRRPGERASADGRPAHAQVEAGARHDREHGDDLIPNPGAAEGTDVAAEPDAAEEITPSSSTSGTPTATRYAAMDRASCEAELGRRGIAFERVDEARGVVAPLRLKGAIAGVEFHSMLPVAQRRTSPYEIYDCRLVLALDDWARVLARHHVVEVVHCSVYRPPPAKQLLSGPGRRHGGALAIDAAIFKMRDGQVLDVEKDFHGRIGSKPCAAITASSLPAPALTLRKLVCEAAEAQLFNVMLTPDYNWPHRNHFHLEVTVGARWVMVR